MNRILLIFIVLIGSFSFATSKSILSIGEIAAFNKDLIQNEKLISPRKEGGVVMLVKDTSLGRVLLLDEEGKIGKEFIIEEQHISKAEVFRESIEVIQLSSGSYVLGSQNLDEQSNAYYRQIILSPELEVVRNTKYYIGSGFRKVQSIYNSNDDTHVVMFSTVSGLKRVKIIKFDINGNVVWSKEQNLPLTIAAIQRSRFLAISDDNGYSFHTFIPSYITTNLISPFSYWFVSYVYDTDGKQKQSFSRDVKGYPYITNDYPSIHGCVNKGDKYRYSFSFYTPTSPFVRIFNASLPDNIVVDTQSVELEHVYGGISRTVVDEDGLTISVGTTHIYSRAISDKTLVEIIPLVREDIQQIRYISFCRRPTGGWWVTGLIEYKDGSVEDILIGLPAQNYTVQGNVFKDLNGDDVQEETEGPFKAPWVNFKSVFNYFSKVKSDGSYNIQLAEDEYDISVKTYSDIWKQSERINQLILTKDTTLNLPVKASSICPELSVNVVAPSLVRCQNNTYEVNYYNTGSAAANQSYAELSIDPYLLVVNSSIPYEILENGKLKFELSVILPDEGGSFSFDAFLNCDSTIQGQTHCVTAKVFPFEKCEPAASCWDGSSIEIEGECVNDSVYIRIINNGERSISPRTMLVLEDDIMIQNPRSLTFGKNETKNFAFKTSGKTIRVEVPQSECYPYKSNPSIVIEGCGGIQQLGLVTTLPQDDDARFVSVNCNESWDQIPDYFLKAAPKGYGSEYLISDTTEIQYTFIFDPDFENQLYLIDTLSDYIDINSLVINSSSHPYDYTVFNNGILKVEFGKKENVTSGYFQFSVKPGKGTPDGSKIYNRGIFFKNSNVGIYSNTIYHTIGQQFISLGPVTSVPAWRNKISVKVYPNPFGQQFRIDFVHKYDNMYLEVFDMQGRMIQKRSLEQNTVISTEDWSKGAYIFRITDGSEVISTGKLFRQ